MANSDCFNDCGLAATRQKIKSTNSQDAEEPSSEIGSVALSKDKDNLALQYNASC